MTEITTTEELNKFLEQVDQFHDAIIRECSIIARGYVDSNKWLHGDSEPFDARVFVQTQFEDIPGVEIIFDGVERFCVDVPFDLQPNGIVEQGNVQFTFSDTGSNEPQVIAAAMRYRILDKNCWGEARLLD